MRLQPITYSLILNLANLIGCVALGLVFSQPLLILAAILLANHSIARFEERMDHQDIDDEAEHYAGGGIGFTADVSKN